MCKVSSNFSQILSHGKHPLSLTPRTHSLQPLALPLSNPSHLLSEGCPEWHTTKSEYRFSNFERTNKEQGTAPESIINRVNSFNLSSFLSNFPENLTLDSIQKKSFRSFLAFV